MTWEGLQNLVLLYSPIDDTRCNNNAIPRCIGVGRSAAEDDEGTLAKEGPGGLEFESWNCLPEGDARFAVLDRERVRNLMRNCLISFGAQDQTRFVFPAIFQGLWRKQGWSSVFGVGRR